MNDSTWLDFKLLYHYETNISTTWSYCRTTTKSTIVTSNVISIHTSTYIQNVIALLPSRRINNTLNVSCVLNFKLARKSPQNNKKKGLPSKHTCQQLYKSIWIRELLLWIFHSFSALARLSLQLFLLDFHPTPQKATKNKNKHITPYTLLPLSTHRTHKEIVFPAVSFPVSFRATYKPLDNILCILCCDWSKYDL